MSYGLTILDCKLAVVFADKVQKKMFPDKWHGDRPVDLLQYPVDCMKMGARDYVTKPFKLDELLALSNQAVEKRRARRDGLNKSMAANGLDNAKFIHCPSTAMQKVYDMVARVAPTDSTVLIQGETGVGKDVLALQIHINSARKDKAFVTLDCGLFLSQNLAESELYGHRKGAFSGASDAKTWLVENSDQGMLFLDEIGNIDLELQKKFLRFLETRRSERWATPRRANWIPGSSWLLTWTFTTR